MRSKCVAVFALWTALAATACHRRATVAPPPPITSAPPVVPRPTPPPVVAPGPEPLPTVAAPPPDVLPLELANRLFQVGSYDEAARAYDAYLKANPTGRYRDEALFYTGLIFVLRPAPKTDWQHAIVLFKQLMDENPNSQYRVQANVILSLRMEIDQNQLDLRQRDQKIKQLTTELDRLKKIDADRRRRP